MKKSQVLLLAGACAIGVFGALRADHWLESRNDHSIQWNTRPNVIQTGYDGGAPAADFRAAAKTVLPSVVSVDRFEEFERMNLETYLRETATGSGVIVGSDGTIVTNNHVVAGASEVRVRLSDKRSFKAKVVGTDPRSDIAVLKITADNLQPVALGDSSKIEVGQWVVAIGNPLGYDGTVSVGVVSGLGRSLIAGGGDEEPQSTLVDAIQTDAAINAGNSGGALTDSQGNLLGINSAMASTTGGNIGIGFAIPVNRVKKVVDDILKLGHVRYGALGVASVPTSDSYLSNPQFRDAMTREVGPNPPTFGLIVRSVVGSSAAEKAGIGQYDVLMELDGTKLTDMLVLTRSLIDKQPGDKVKLRYWHKGEVKDSVITLQELNDN